MIAARPDHFDALPEGIELLDRVDAVAEQPAGCPVGDLEGPAVGVSDIELEARSLDPVAGPIFACHDTV